MVILNICKFTIKRLDSISDSSSNISYSNSKFFKRSKLVLARTRTFITRLWFDSKNCDSITTLVRKIAKLYREWTCAGVKLYREWSVPGSEVARRLSRNFTPVYFFPNNFIPRYNFAWNCRGWSCRSEVVRSEVVREWTCGSSVADCQTITWPNRCVTLLLISRANCWVLSHFWCWW